MDYKEVKSDIDMKMRQNLYYVIIGVVSFLALIFLPFLGSEVGLEFSIPDTIAGWCVWVGVKLILSVLNVLIFHSFICQAKLNIRDDEKFKKANEILEVRQKKHALPRSPKRYMSQTYGRKGTTLFITTALATIALTQAILTFDWVAMLTYLFTILMGVIFGLLTMKNTEIYWTDEYYAYAMMIETKLKEEEAHSEALTSDITGVQGKDDRELAEIQTPLTEAKESLKGDNDND